ncbi:glycosyltransferase family 4 protein [Salinarimonas chemoclinalis]|uniref:glycosyltransferase family 4 protein n=1 Tax=Salinarimonas chemoclinalis TaxID=3241599 RepID=UPI0035580570
MALASPTPQPSDLGSDPAAGCAILYVPEAYEGDKANVVGRQSAGAGFLDALARYGGAAQLSCLAEDPQVFEAFRRRVSGHADAARARWVRPFDAAALEEVGSVFLPGPIISEGAWMRRFVGERRYSLCGITHSVATERVIRSIRDLVVAPTQPWDALICTSDCARQAIRHVLDGWRDYLGARGFIVPDTPVRFPVIPLGVHLDRFARTAEREAAGRGLRAELGIAEDAVVALGFGRLDHRSKAHPVPLFRAIELAARRAGEEADLHLVLVGQFADEEAERNFRAASRLFCPSVPVHWIDGRETPRADASWAAADLFVSLPDNVQETFGLTPVEAMAAGLPCVVADWNGYRETVVEGQTGFRVPTLMAPAGAGIDMADEHARASFDHFAHIAFAAQCIAVDVDAAAHAIARLAGNADLRRTMGAAGRRRAESVYDWRRVVRLYEDLWAELAALRAEAPVLGGRAPERTTVHPDFPDLFAMFAGHPTRALTPESRVTLADPDPRFALAGLRRLPIATLARPILLDDFQIDRLVARLESGAASVDALLETLPRASRAAGLRSLAWLAKYGVVAIGVEAPDEGLGW